MKSVLFTLACLVAVVGYALTGPEAQAFGHRSHAGHVAASCCAPVEASCAAEASCSAEYSHHREGLFSRMRSPRGPTWLQWPLG